MKTIRLLCAALLPLLTAGNAPAEPKPLPWLVAQDRRFPTCELDGHKAPVGATFCREGRVWECSMNGTWQSTGKEC